MTRVVKPQAESPEQRRHDVLRRFGVFDDQPDQGLDDLIALAGYVCKAPYALISFADGRSYGLTKAGGSTADVPSDAPFRAHAISRRDLFIIPDASEDERVAADPVVTGPEHIRFYAGAALVTPEGDVIGALSVMDCVARDLTASQQAALRVVSRQVMAQLELRRRTRQLADSEARLRIVTDDARVGLVIVNAARRYVYANRAYAEILGLPSPDIVGQRVRDILPKVFDEQIAPRLDRAFSGERLSYELRKPAVTGERYYAVTYEPTELDGPVSLVSVVITEITGHRQGERASSHLAAIVESSADAIIGKDLDGIITSWNRGAERLFGHTAAEMLGTSILRLIPVDRHDEERRILQMIRDNKGVSIETVRQTSDGRLIDVSVTASPIKDANGRIIGASKVARDISERRRAETALRQERDRAQRYLDTADVLLLGLDLGGRITSVNRKACELLGWAEHELVGREYGEAYIPLRFRHASKESFGKLIGGDLRLRERPVVTRSGEERMIEWRNTLLRDETGRVTGAFCSGTDVTERNKAIEALRVTEERMRFALQSADVGIWDMDYTTGKLQWSEILEAQYGLQPGAFGGTFEAFVERIHPDDRAAVLETVGMAMRSGEDFSVQNRTLGLDGKVRWLTGAGRIMLGEHGEPVRGVGVSLDVTERHTLEEQYYQAQKMEAIGRLAGGVAHDFNNLLTVMLGFCDLSRADLAPSDPRQADLEEIQKAGQRASALTRQLLAFSRKEIIEPVVVDLNAATTEVRPMLERLIGEDIAVELRLSADLAPIRADPGQVHQIIMNLAVNARDAMPAGGELRIETANVELDEHYARAHLAVQPGVYVVLTVTDTGAGMTPEVQSRLFEPFFTTKEMGRGTGLGLATVHGIVARAGGSIGVYSEVGKGTTFNVYFPKADESESVVEKAPEAVKERDGSETVLVVEDSRQLRDLAKRLLERRGYTVLLAANADEASRLFEQAPHIDVLLTDVVMPGESGPDLTKRLVTRRPSLKVIYMSGYTEDAITHHGVLKPGIAFVHKPFTSQTLERKLRDVLDR